MYFYFVKPTFLSIGILLIAILAISIFYQYPAMLDMLPQGAHLWRQADCMAMTQNYQQFHLSFLQPATYNLQSTNGNVVGEFPIFYFIAAQFKNAVFALRLIHSIIFIVGIVATYFIAFYFIQRRLLSIFCSILIFTSPLLVFYGNNFLSDIPALSFAFIGWAILLNAYKKENYLAVIIAFLCFAFATLLKASEAIHFAIAFVFIISTRKINLKSFTPFLLFLIPICWYSYAKSYNLQNHDSYYFLSIFPIWKLSFNEIGLGIWRMFISNSYNYFWHPTSIILIFSIYFLAKNNKKLGKELIILILSSFLLVTLYILFFYQKMIGHEYYYIPFFVFVLFGIIGLFKVYNIYHSENVFGHTFIFLCLLVNIIYCRNIVAEKLKIPLYNGYLASDEMQLFLEKNNVQSNNSILSLPDDSPNKTLYLLKRKGYSEYNNYETILKNKKAEFLLVEFNFAQQHQDLKPYLNDSLGNFNGFILYKLCPTI